MTLSRPSLKTSSTAGRIEVVHQALDALTMRNINGGTSASLLSWVMRLCTWRAEQPPSSPLSSREMSSSSCWSNGSSSGMSSCLTRALGEDHDEAGVCGGGRDQIDVAQPARARLGRRGQARGVGGRGDGRRREAEPLLAGELDLAELVADHQLLDGRDAASAARSTRRTGGSPRPSARDRRWCAGGSGSRPIRARP